MDQTCCSLASKTCPCNRFYLKARLRYEAPYCMCHTRCEKVSSSADVKIFSRNSRSITESEFDLFSSPQMVDWKNVAMDSAIIYTSPSSSSIFMHWYSDLNALFQRLGIPDRIFIRCIARTGMSSPTVVVGRQETRSSWCRCSAIPAIDCVMDWRPASWNSSAFEKIELWRCRALDAARNIIFSQARYMNSAFSPSDRLCDEGALYWIFDGRLACQPLRALM